MPSRREYRKTTPPPLALAVSRKQVFTRICSKDLHQASHAQIAAISAGDWTMDPSRRRLIGHGTTTVPKPAPSGPPCPPVDALQICRPTEAHLGKARPATCAAATGAPQPREERVCAVVPVTLAAGRPLLLAAGAPPSHESPPPIEYHHHRARGRPPPPPSLARLRWRGLGRRQEGGD